MGNSAQNVIGEVLMNDPFLSQRQPIFWIMGPSKCGKTTIGNFLGVSSRFEVIHIDKMLKQEVAKNSQFSKYIAHCMERGHNVKSRIIVALLKDIFFGMKDSAKGFILDGFPISITQAKCFENSVRKPDLIIYTTLVLDTLFGRILMMNGEADLEKARQVHIKMTRCCNNIYKSYTNRVHRVIANYPAEETITKLIADLEFFWGFKFDQIFMSK